MYSLTVEQIDYILNDIKERGVKIESIRLNLLDHICCIIEKDPETEKDFEAVYQRTIKTFFKNDLAEIEKEAILLLNFKHYYKMKQFLYILLFASLIYNVFFISKYTSEYFSSKKDMKEITLIKTITLKEGYEDLIKKLKEKYPNISVKDKIYISYLSDAWPSRHQMPNSEMAESMGVSLDSLIKKQKFNKDRRYRSTDSLAGVYKNVTFIVAYQRTSGEIDDVIEEYATKTKNLYFLKGMNEIFSGYENHRTKNKKSSIMGFANMRFVIDKKGDLVYGSSLFWEQGFEKGLIKSLSQDRK